MRKEKPSHRETARQFEINDDKRIAAWEGICLTEGSEGFAIEQHGRSKNHTPKQLPNEVEEGLPPAIHRQQALSAA